MTYDVPVIERLRFNTELQPNGCIEWTGCCTAEGYGQTKAYGEHLAHRVAYRHFIGRIGKREIIRHTCDNPKCVSPSHLQKGTHQDNSDDKFRRGRARFDPSRKLTDEDIRAIKKSTGVQQDVADAYGISRPMVSLIRNGKVHSNV